MSLKWSYVRQNVTEQLNFIIIEYSQYKLVGTSSPHVASLPKLPLPNLVISGTKLSMLHVIAHQIALLIMEDGGCNLTIAKVTNPNFIKAMAKLSCFTHSQNQNDYTTNYKPNIGVQLNILTELASSTLSVNVHQVGASHYYIMRTHMNRYTLLSNVMWHE